MRLDPFVQVDDCPFGITPEELVRLKGPPGRRLVNGVGLQEFDYGRIVYRFQACGRLEEVTERAPVVHLGGVVVPFRSLEGFIAAQDPGAFRRAGFRVSPRFGLAFVPEEPDWVTALARHCLPQWLSLVEPGPP
jgi:hypothetical protein